MKKRNVEQHDNIQSYDDIIDLTWEYEKILFKEYIGSYQGDLVVIFEDNGKFGLLVQGYGSCTGCDELIGIVYDHNDGRDVTDQLNGISQRMFDSIMWHDSLDDLAETALERNGNYWYSYDYNFRVIIDSFRQ